MVGNYWIGKKVLITGASGFVGRHLLATMLQGKAEVAATELDGIVPMVDHIYKCNLANYDDVNRVISRFQPEIIFHLAAQPLVNTAYTAPLDTLETNIRGTYNLLDVCSKIGNVLHFIHFSTDKVYGESNPALTGSIETDGLEGVAHPYNASKLCGDMIAQSYMNFSIIPISIIRSGNIYGEGDTHWDRLIPYICKMLATDKSIELRSDGFMYRDYIYIDDVIEALLLVGADKSTSIYNLGADQPYTVKDIVQKLREISGVEDKSIPVYKANTHLELKYQHMNYAKIKERLGWIPKVGIDEGLTKTFAWYKAQYGQGAIWK